MNTDINTYWYEQYIANILVDVLSSINYKMYV